MTTSAVCRVCLAEKSIALFERVGNTHRKLCKDCRYKQTRKWVEANRDRVAAISIAHRAKDPEAYRSYHAKYRADNAQKISSAMREYCRTNSTALADRKREYAAQNAELVRKQQAASHLKNRAARLVAQQKYYESAIELFRSLRAKRRAAKLKATPAWFGEFDEFVVREAYRLAVIREALFGFKWHVDHVIPLQGKSVCGLHIHNNLAVIPATDNLRKGNRYA